MNAPYRPCPDDEVLQELAAGLSSAELAERTLQHVSRCNVCGPALKRYMREFSEQDTPETARILNQLESSRPEWQRSMVRKVVQPRRARWPRLIPVFAGLAAVLFLFIAGPYLLREFKIRQAQKEVAAAFAERRTTENRLPSTDYSTFRGFPVELGPERSVDELPPSLHNALSSAIENLKQPNADPRWLQIQGRAFLWEATPSSLEKAEKNFEKARAEGLNTTSLEIDLATAYYERDNKSDHPNLQRTLDLLNKVLTEPNLTGQDRASALFNLAIAYERTQAWDLAVETWEKYLQVDSSSQWAEEAKRHLKEGKEKIEKPAAASSLDPASFLNEAGKGTVNDHLEEYLDVVVTSWLPDGLENRDSHSWTAAQKLAGILTTQHHDLWLKDLLSSLSDKDGPAVKALALAVQENGRGEHVRAMEQAREAARFFAQSRSPAGAFRAQLEEVNAFRRTLNGPACLARADPLLRELSTTRYYWLQARVAVEKAECGNLVGAFAESDSSLNMSRQIATQSGFPILALRDIGMAAGNQHLRGNCDQSWQEAVAGLHLYWQGTFSSRDRLYQFYSVISQCAFEDGALYAGEEFLRHAISMRETSHEIKKNPIMEGALHLRLSNVLLARGANQEAERERGKASELLRQKGLSNKFKLILDLERAEFQLQHGDARASLATLEPLGKLLADNPDSFFSLRYHQTLAKTQFKSGELPEAAASYQDAINTAEAALDNITDWTERLQWLRSTDESYRGLVRVLLEQKKTGEALERWELYRSKPLLNGKSIRDMGAIPVRMHTPAQAGKFAMPNDRSPRIIYAGFHDGIQIWVAWKAEIRGAWVSIDKADLDNSTRQFIEMCASEGSNLTELQQLGANLFDKLLQPVVSDLPGSGELTIELDPSAYNLPMEALRTPNGRYFGESYSVVYSPGVWMEKELRSPMPITGQESLMLVDASQVERAGYLAGFASQRDTIATLFPRTQVINSAKTDWSVARARLATAQLFHYMGHGRPDGSGTSLDYDAHRLLRANDFAPKLLSRTEMVVLSACSGAAGREYGIADTSNLVRVFLGAGVPSVIASHWNVDAASTSLLMDSFYLHLTKKESVAQAMYNARIDMLRANPHPYFWAGFGLSGRAS